MLSVALNCFTGFRRDQIEYSEIEEVFSDVFAMTLRIIGHIIMLIKIA
jgi:hypothetical protein